MFFEQNGFSKTQDYVALSVYTRPSSVWFSFVS